VTALLASTRRRDARLPDLSVFSSANFSSDLLPLGEIGTPAFSEDSSDTEDESQHQELALDEELARRVNSEQQAAYTTSFGFKEELAFEVEVTPGMAEYAEAKDPHVTYIKESPWAETAEIVPRVTERDMDQRRKLNAIEHLDEDLVSVNTLLKSQELVAVQRQIRGVAVAQAFVITANTNSFSPVSAPSRQRRPSLTTAQKEANTERRTRPNMLRSASSLKHFATVDTTHSSKINVSTLAMMKMKAMHSKRALTANMPEQAKVEMVTPSHKLETLLLVRYARMVSSQHYIVASHITN
jgi:hypothetical protein